MVTPVEFGFDSANVLAPEKICDNNKVTALMQVRFRVVNLWLNCAEKIGNVLIPMIRARIDEYRKYPHLLKEMHWWEDRDLIQMPAYVMIGGKYPLEVTGGWYMDTKSPWFIHQDVQDPEAGAGEVYAYDCKPITKREYDSLKAKQK